MVLHYTMAGKIAITDKENPEFVFQHSDDCNVGDGDQFVNGGHWAYRQPTFSLLF